MDSDWLACSHHNLICEYSVLQYVAKANLSNSVLRILWSHKLCSTAIIVSLMLINVRVYTMLYTLSNSMFILHSCYSKFKVEIKWACG